MSHPDFPARQPHHHTPNSDASPDRRELGPDRGAEPLGGSRLPFSSWDSRAELVMKYIVCVCEEWRDSVS